MRQRYFPLEYAGAAFQMLAALFCAVVGCAKTPAPADPNVGQRVAEAFLAQIRAGQYDAAWQSTSAEFKSAEGREAFAENVKKKPFLRQPLNFVGYEVADLNGLKRGQCTYESAGNQKSTPARVRLIVSQDASEWRVDGMFVE